MLVVALETSTGRPSVAAQDGARVEQAWLSGERAHASDLLPALAQLLERLGRAPREIEAVVVGRGPGSYTGLRVGAATALGLARGSGARLLGLCSFEALAWRALAPGAECAVLQDARAGELYVARYRREEHGVRTLLEPRTARAEELALLVQPDDALLGAPGVERVAQLPAERLARLQTGVLPEAAALLELAAADLARGTAHPAAGIEPLYLRAFAATTRRR